MNEAGSSGLGVCTECKGDKFKVLRPPKMLCAFCRGTGCETCHNTGYLCENCPICKGTGKVPVQSEDMAAAILKIEQAQRAERLERTQPEYEKDRAEYLASKASVKMKSTALTIVCPNCSKLAHEENHACTWCGLILDEDERPQLSLEDEALRKSARDAHFRICEENCYKMLKPYVYLELAQAVKAHVLNRETSKPAPESEEKTLEEIYNFMYSQRPHNYQHRDEYFHIKALQAVADAAVQRERARPLGDAFNGMSYNDVVSLKQQLAAKEQELVVAQKQRNLLADLLNIGNESLTSANALIEKVDVLADDIRLHTNSQTHHGQCADKIRLSIRNYKETNK